MAYSGGRPLLSQAGWTRRRRGRGGSLARMLQDAFVKASVPEPPRRSAQPLLTQEGTLARIPERDFGGLFDYSCKAALGEKGWCASFSPLATLLHVWSHRKR